MSTIASPRQSLTIASRRDSISTDDTRRSTSTSRAAAPTPTGTVRRNRNALRDYYGLKTASREADSGSPATPAEVEPEPENEIDRPGFDADDYVKKLLAKESLEGILRVEATLISETKNLDGEKKALIYDNYSKLIAATQTIKKMRTNMDPLSPTTSTLTPAISHIAQAATELSELLKQQERGGDEGVGGRQAAQKQLVRWVLDGPARLQSLKAKGDRTAAGAEWLRIEELLNKWKGVDGAKEVYAACMAVLKE